MSILNFMSRKKNRRIEYITFPVLPSDQDDLDAKKWIEDIKADFENAEDNIQFVNSNSDESFDATWKKEDELTTDLANWIYFDRAEENDVFGPYFADGAYKLAKLHKVEMMPDSVEARHILLRYNDATQLAAKQALADSLKTVIEDGGDFTMLATQYSEDTGSAIKGGDLGWFSRNQMVKPFEEAAFGAKVREVTIVQSQFGIHVIQTTKRGVETRQVQIATLVRKVEPSDATYQKIYAQASKFASENTNLEEFEAAVKNDGSLTKKVVVVKEHDRDIAGLENARSFIRSAYEAEEGDLLTDFRGSTIFELGDNFVIGSLVKAIEEGIAPFEDVEARVELAVIKEKKAEYLMEKAKSALAANDDFSVAASELNAEIKSADKLNFNSFSIPGIGVEPAVIGTMASLELDKVSKPVKGNNGVYIIKITDISEGINTDLVAEQKRMIQSLGYRANYEAYEAVKEASEIVDKRSKFY